MFDLGMQELLVIMVVALIVIGPKNLPDLARKMGEGFGSLRKSITEARNEIDQEMRNTGQALDLKDVPSVKSDDLKRAIQEKALEAAGLSPQIDKSDAEEGGPRNEPSTQAQDSPEAGASPYEPDQKPDDENKGDGGKGTARA